MKWEKRGLIFDPEKDSEWMISHAQVPFVDHVDADRLRVYFSTRDEKGRAHPTYIEVSSADPKTILYVHDAPILPLGKPGTFDDNGIMSSWIVDYQNKKYLYYIGWNPQVTVSYRLSIGLAISEDGGKTFEKYSEGPICDRSVDEPYFNTAPCVRLEGNLWRMWYVSCTGWETIDEWPEPRYHVKYAESDDGVHWNKESQPCINYDDFSKAIGRPCVYFEDDRYKMLYSYRGLKNYRTSPNTSYRLGYAESADGRDWTRKDDCVGITMSKEGWDSIMIEYCHVYFSGEERLLFYNGNGFGQSGIGYALLQKDE